MAINLLIATLFGLISGGLTALLVKGSTYEANFLFLPGILFTIAIYGYFFIVFNLRNTTNLVITSIFNVVIYNFAGLVGFFAQYFFRYGSGPMYIQPGLYASLFISGLFGAAFCAIVLRLVFIRYNIKDIGLISLTGGVLGLLGLFPNSKEQFVLLFVFWQAGVLATIALRATRDKILIS